MCINNQHTHRNNHRYYLFVIDDGKLFARCHCEKEGSILIEKQNYIESNIKTMGTQEKKNIDMEVVNFFADADDF